MPTSSLFIQAERGLAKWKRKNPGVGSVSVNGLVRIVQANRRAFNGDEISYDEALQVLILEFKANAPIFADLVRERLGKVFS